jgi:hypothetical protein
MMTELNIANNRLCVKAGRSDMSGVISIASSIKHMGALLSLNLSGNGLVPMVLPVGWTYNRTKGYDDSYYDEFTHTDGRKQGTDPSQPDFTGVIALADVIPDMRAMTSLNLASNTLGVEGAKIIAACLPKCM